MFKELKRMVYTVTDLAAAKAWYADLLGSPPLFDAPFAAIFAVGDGSLTLTGGVPADPAATGGPVAYWEVDDIDAALAGLLERGARQTAPVSAALGVRTAQVADPFGNRIGITDAGAPASRGGVGEKPSETAMTVAFCRALAALEERPELRGPDYLAGIFLRPEARSLLETREKRRWAVENLVTEPLYGYFLARTAWLDACFLDACREGLPQIVLLGAGYDTRALRYRNELGGTRVFEMDIKTTQERKAARLREAGIDLPPGLVHAPIDFEAEKPEDALFRAGYDPELRTLFLWEGVMYYLTRGTVEGMLRFLSAQAPGGRLCFDCMREKLQSVNPAEPFLFWAEPDDMDRMLTAAGLRPADRLDREGMVRRYLSDADGHPLTPCLSAFSFCTAEI